MKLYTYWRSSASYRVRIALNFKGLPYQSVPVDLRDGAQRLPEYTALNPQGLLPTLVHGAVTLSQSPAILEYLEELYPGPPLLPDDPGERALIRQMAMVVACEVHPLQNLGVLAALSTDFGADEKAREAWARRVIGKGLLALEELTTRHGGNGPFCFGEDPTLADVYLVPQMYNARRYGVDMAALPNLVCIDEACNRLEAFDEARPEVQPDAPQPG